MSGGAMLGNNAMGKERIEIAPMITVRTATTMATMGRLMKNFDTGLFPPGLRHKGLRVHLHTRAHLLHSFCYYAIAWLQPL